MRAILRGSTAASVLRRATPRQRRRLRRVARRRGITLDALVRGIPQPLAQRTPQGIRRLARRNIVQSYRPVFADLREQERQVRALDEKRAADNRYYQEWLDNRMRELTAQSDAFAADIANRQQQLAAQQQAMFAAAGDSLTHANMARSGRVTLGDQEQQAAQSALAPHESFAGNLMAAEQSRTLGQQRIDGDALRAAAANALLAHAAEDSRRQSETARALSDIAGERNKAKAQRAADLQREIARLLDQEVSKASSLEQLDLARDELGMKERLETGKMKLEARKLVEVERSNRANEAIRREANRIRRDLQLNLADWRRTLKSLRIKERRLDARKLQFKKEVEAYARRHRLGKYAPKRLSPNQQASRVDRAARAYQIAQILQRAGAGSKAWSMLAAGGSVRSRRGSKLDWLPFSDLEIRAGRDLAKTGGVAVSRATWRAWKRALGIDLSRRYQVRDRL